jgi:putative transposase
VLSVQRQCALLGLARSSFYCQPVPESRENLHLMREIDKIYTKCPFYGARRILAELKHGRDGLNIKRVRRLMAAMGIEAVCPKPNLSAKGEGREIFRT